MSLFKRRPVDTRTPEDLEGIWCNQRLDVGQFNHGAVKTTLVAAAFPSSPMFGSRCVLPPLVDGSRACALVKQAIAGAISNDELVAAVFGASSFLEYVDQVDEAGMSSRGATPRWILDRLAATNVTQEWRSAIQRGLPQRDIYELLDDVSARLAGHSLVRVQFCRGGITGSLWLDAARAGFCATIYPLAAVDSDFGWTRTRYEDPYVVTPMLFRRANAPHPLEVLPDELLEMLDSIVADLVAGAERRHGHLTAAECRPRTFDGPTPYAASLTRAAIAGAMLAVVGIDSSACRMYGGSPKRLLAPDEHHWPDGPGR